MPRLGLELGDLEPLRLGERRGQHRHACRDAPGLDQLRADRDARRRDAARVADRLAQRERLAEVADADIAIAELGVAAAEVVQRERLVLAVAQLGEQLARPVVGHDRLGEPARVVLQDAEIEQRDALGGAIARLALDRECALQVAERLVAHALPEQDRPDVGVRLGLEERKVEPLERVRRGEVVRERLLRVAGLELAVREVVERDRAALLVAGLRGMRERALERGDRLAVAALRLQHVADAVVHGREAGVVARALAEVGRPRIRRERRVVVVAGRVQVAEVGRRRARLPSGCRWPRRARRRARAAAWRRRTRRAGTAPRRSR
jgi:hypothetical protein